MRILWVFFLLPSALSESGINKKCITPNGAIGTCQEATSCPLFLKYLQVSNSSSVRKYFKQSICGERYKMKLICCGHLASNPFEECGVRKEETTAASDLSGKHFPWMAAIQYRNGNEKPVFRCQGFLINQNFILTAAHCLKNSRIHSVILGISNLSNFADQESYRKLQVLNVSYHENYKVADDIGLIRIETVKYEDKIRWICLPTKNSPIPDWFTVRGWGMNNNKSVFTITRQNLIPSVTYSHCPHASRRHIEENKIICAGGEPNKDVCDGDSGGALMNKTELAWTAFGIVAFGSKDCSRGDPGVYTKIQYYLDWLDRTMIEML